MPRKDNRVVLEAYPKLVAQFIIGDAQYKGRIRSASPGRKRTNRGAILEVLRGERQGKNEMSSSKMYGVTVKFAPSVEKTALDDTEGDTLDAVLCAVQAAWAYTKRDFLPAPYGIPPKHNDEGWIVDPSLLTS